MEQVPPLQELDAVTSKRCPRAYSKRRRLALIDVMTLLNQFPVATFIKAAMIALGATGPAALKASGLAEAKPFYSPGLFNL
jgi:hypothetical protein